MYDSFVSRALSRTIALIALTVLAGSVFAACDSSSGSAKAAFFPGIASIQLAGGRLWVVTQSGGFRQRGEVFELDAANGSIIRAWNGRADHLWSPIGVVVAHGAAWILNQYGGADYQNNRTGSVVELSLASGSVIRTIGGHGQALGLPEGMATDGRAVWVADNLGTGVNGGATEIDATTGRITRVIGSQQRFGEPQGLALARGEMWTANFQSSYGLVSAFRAGDGSAVPTATRTPDGYCAATAIASSPRSVWIAEDQCPQDGYGTIAEIDPTTGALVRTISVGTPAVNSPGDLAVTGSSVWVMLSSGSAFSSEVWGKLVEVNAATGKINREIGVPKVSTTPWPGEHAIVATATRIWVVNESQVGLIELDARTGKVIRSVACDAGRAYCTND
jgi:hypothetical protein